MLLIQDLKACWKDASFCIRNSRPQADYADEQTKTCPGYHNLREFSNGCLRAGDHLRHTLLESGGAKHPLQIMLSVLGSEGLSPFSNGWGPTANALQARLNQTE